MTWVVTQMTDAAPTMPGSLLADWNKLRSASGCKRSDTSAVSRAGRDGGDGLFPAIAASVTKDRSWPFAAVALRPEQNSGRTGRHSHRSGTRHAAADRALPPGPRPAAREAAGDGDAREHLQAARTAYDEMGMTTWLERATSA